MEGRASGVNCDETVLQGMLTTSRESPSAVVGWDGIHLAIIAATETTRRRMRGRTLCKKGALETQDGKWAGGQSEIRPGRARCTDYIPRCNGGTAVMAGEVLFRLGGSGLLLAGLSGWRLAGFVSGRRGRVAERTQGRREESA